VLLARVLERLLLADEPARLEQLLQADVREQLEQQLRAVVDPQHHVQVLLPGPLECEFLDKQQLDPRAL
jgi:hypothetical protein